MSVSSIGERIRNIRGVESRKAFAQKFEIGTATLQRYEDNERSPDVEFLVRLQKYAQVTLDYLVNGEDLSLSTEEKNLLNNYRAASRELKNQTQLFLIGVDPLINATENVANQPTHTGSGDQFNAKKQKVDKRSRVNNFNGGFGGDYVEGDKNNH